MPAQKLPPEFRCNQCGTEFESYEVRSEHLFHCATCKQHFVSSSNRCPDCNLFGKKIAQRGCLQCGEGQLVELKHPSADNANPESPQ